MQADRIVPLAPGLTGGGSAPRRLPAITAWRNQPVQQPCNLLVSHGTGFDAGFCGRRRPPRGGSALAWVEAQEQRAAEKELRSAVQPRTIERLRTHPKALSRTVAVRGRVRAEKPFTAELSGLEVAAVRTVEELVTEKRQEAQEGGEPRWARSTSMLKNHTRSTDWSLADGSGAELPIELPLHGGRALLSGVMQNGGDCLVPNREKGRDRVAEEQLGDRTVGVEKSEQILPLGTVLTAMGSVHSVVGHPDGFKDAIRSTSGRMLVLRPSLLSHKTMDTLIDEAEQKAKELEGIAKGCMWIGGGLVAGGSVAGVVTVAARHADGRGRGR